MEVFLPLESLEFLFFPTEKRNQGGDSLVRWFCTRPDLQNSQSRGGRGVPRLPPLGMRGGLSLGVIRCLCSLRGLPSRLQSAQEVDPFMKISPPRP